MLCAETLYRARQLRRPGIVLAGERHCVKPPGFDQGNSPGDAAVRRGVELALATTNGAPTIVAAAQHAPRVLLACMLNLDAVLRALGDDANASLQIVCSGTDAAVALEDVYVAGRLSAELPGDRTDAALVAERVARAFESPLVALAASADARVLSKAGLTADIAHCGARVRARRGTRRRPANAGVAAVAELEHVGGVASSVDADDTVSV